MPYNQISKVDTVENIILAKDFKNQVWNNQVRQEQLKVDTDQLQKAKLQLLASKKTLDLLNQDYSNIVAYQQTKAERQLAIQNALEGQDTRLKEADLAALIARQRGLGRKAIKGMSPSVLENIQRTTGISPQEIDRLMNQ